MPDRLPCPACGAEGPAQGRACARCGAGLEAPPGEALLEAARHRRAVGEDAQRAALRGLVGVGVQVDPLNADVEADGLETAALRAVVESALRERGLAVLAVPRLMADVPGAPFLHVDLRAVRLDAAYVYSLRLELWEVVQLSRDPAIRTLGVTWSAAPAVGTVPAARVDTLRDVVGAAAVAFGDEVALARGPAALPRAGGPAGVNLLVSSSWRGRRAVEEEIRALLRSVGDAAPRLEPTEARGLLAVGTGLEPRGVIRALGAAAASAPRRFRFTRRWAPVDAWVSADLGAVAAAAATLAERIRPHERWRATVQTHGPARLHAAEVVAAVADRIDRKVDLTTPDRVLRVDVIGAWVALAVMRPGDVLVVPVPVAGRPADAPTPHASPPPALPPG